MILMGTLGPNAKADNKPNTRLQNEPRMCIAVAADGSFAGLILSHLLLGSERTNKSLADEATWCVAYVLEITRDRAHAD